MNESDATPPSLREISMREPTSEGDRRSLDWLKAAVAEYDRSRRKGSRSSWLPGNFDAESSCSGSGPYGECRDCHCSVPGVAAPGHDRRRRGSDSQAACAPLTDLQRPESQAARIGRDAA